MIRLLSTCILLSLSLITTQAQSAERVNKREAEFDENTLNKNALYLSMGITAQSLNYEVNIANTKRSALHLKTGIGFNQALFNDNGQFISTGISYITGRMRKNHLEINAGGLLSFESESYDYSKRMHFAELSIRDFLNLNFLGYIGYRYQKPGGHFIFRFGYGYPEITSVSFGYAF